VVLSGLLVLIQLGVIDNTTMSLNLPISHKYSDLHDDWFPVDPYVLTAENDAQYVKRPEVTKHCATVSGPRLANVVTIASVLHNGLWWMGGTGHWFHFSERILPMLSEAYDNVWGPAALASKVHSKGELYIGRSYFHTAPAIRRVT
jgi:hypothetical protein